MRRVLETDAGKELYVKRKSMIEPVFAQTKFNRRIDRFQRRGRSACRSVAGVGEHDLRRVGDASLRELRLGGVGDGSELAEVVAGALELGREHDLAFVDDGLRRVALDEAGARLDETWSRGVRR
jgi:hypothetical protein